MRPKASTSRGFIPTAGKVLVKNAAGSRYTPSAVPPTTASRLAAKTSSQAHPTSHSSAGTGQRAILTWVRRQFQGA